jgi:alpha-beta hydrolase superfamily lysophospholipase
MGSFVARDYISHYGKEIDGVIVMGTGGPNPAASAGIVLAHTISALCGPMCRPKLINDIAFGGYTSRIENALTGYEWLSRDPEIIEKYARDERCTFIFTVSAFADLFKILARVNTKRWGASVPTALPILLIAGSEDPVGNYGEGVKQVLALLQKAGHQNTDLVLYPEMRHEILNEYEKEKVYGDLLNWIDKVLTK